MGPELRTTDCFIPRSGQSNSGTEVWLVFNTDIPGWLSLTIEASTRFRNVRPTNLYSCIIQTVPLLYKGNSIALNAAIFNYNGMLGFDKMTSDLPTLIATNPFLLLTTLSTTSSIALFVNVSPFRLLKNATVDLAPFHPKAFERVAHVREILGRKKPLSTIYRLYYLQIIFQKKMYFLRKSSVYLFSRIRGQRDIGLCNMSCTSTNSSNRICSRKLNFCVNAVRRLPLWR